jgi:hypothetical protein
MACLSWPQLHRQSAVIVLRLCAGAVPAAVRTQAQACEPAAAPSAMRHRQPARQLGAGAGAGLQAAATTGPTGFVDAPRAAGAGGLQHQRHGGRVLSAGESRVRNLDNANLMSCAATLEFKLCSTGSFSQEASAACTSKLCKRKICAQIAPCFRRCCACKRSTTRRRAT